MFSGYKRQTNVSKLTFGHKEVEHCDNNRVPTEHVVSTCLDPCQCHPKSTPDGECPLYLSEGVVISLHTQKKTEAMRATENNGGSSSFSVSTKSSPHLFSCVSHLTGTLQVLTRHGEGGDEHCATTEKEHGSHQRTQSPQQNGPAAHAQFIGVKTDRCLHDGNS